VVVNGDGVISNSNCGRRHAAAHVVDVRRCYTNVQLFIMRTKRQNQKYVDGLRRRTVDRHTSPRRVHFWKMLSVTLTSQPITLKMSPCHVHLVLSKSSLSEDGNEVQGLDKLLTCYAKFRRSFVHERQITTLKFYQVV